MGFKISLQKSIAFPYTNNIHVNKEIMATLSLTITSKKIQHLGINLTKEVKNSYNENSKSLRQRPREALGNGVILCPWIIRIIIVKITVLPKSNLQI